MRAGLSILLVLAATTATAAAHSPLPPEAPVPAERESTRETAPARIELPSANVYLYRHREDAEGLLLDNPHAPAAPERALGPSIDIGSFHAEIGGTGTHAHLAHYTLQGVQVMGGAISGTIDGRSARISIDW